MGRGGVAGEVGSNSRTVLLVINKEGDKTVYQHHHSLLWPTLTHTWYLKLNKVKQLCVLLYIY